MKPNDPLQEKHQIRAAAHLRRLHQQDGDRLSRLIFERLVLLPQYLSARTVLCYVSFRSEVSTHAFISRMWADGKQVVVPYCVAQHLELFCFSSFSDLAPGTLGILEPKRELRGQDHQQTKVQDLDLLVIPGLAFDRHGGRLGYGKGYFDRLLSGARPDALLAAVAFECQLFDAVPVQPYDVRVDAVITEIDIYRRTLPRCNSTHGDGGMTGF
ncbi:MAG: 5-formyltetrahydrofolate cyclo-ligase [Thermoguttaceae bacterium]